MAERKHASLGGSSVERVEACPGSRELASQAPPQPTSVWAAEGTMVHDVIEKCLQRGRGGKWLHEPEAEVGMPFEVDGHEFEFTETHAKNARIFVDHVRALVKGRGKNLMTEVYVKPSIGDPNAGGYVDAAVFDSATSTLHVVDYKNGAGKVVDVTTTPQLVFYALGIIDERLQCEPQRVVCTIIQPNAGGDAIRSVTYDQMDMMEWRERFTAIAAASRAPDAPRVPGGHCHWCPAKGVCPERAAQMGIPSATEAFGEGTAIEPYVPSERASVALPRPLRLLTTPVDLLTPEELSEVLPVCEALETRIQDVYVRAHALAEGGTRIPDYCLEAKRPSKKWVDEERAKSVLYDCGLTVDDIEPRKLVTPAAAEKLVAAEYREALAAVIEKVSSGTNLVRAADAKRPVVTAESVFTTIEEETSRG